MKSKLMLLLACSVLLVITANAQKNNNPQAETAIRAVLDAQTEAWNKGKLEEFMQGYWRSPKLTFYSAGNKRAGYDAVLERYRKTYQSDGKEMGKVTFSEVEVEMLGKKAAVVRGRWGLMMADGKKLGGLYTLLLRHFKKDGWKIIHDHTSSEQ